MNINQLSNLTLASTSQVSTIQKSPTQAAASINNTVGAGGASSTADQASLSAASTLLVEALRTPDVRTEKVAALQASIAAVTYNISSADVAGKLVESLLS